VRRRLLCCVFFLLLAACDDDATNNANNTSNVNNTSNINNTSSTNNSLPCTGPEGTTYCSGETIVLCGLGAGGYQEFLVTDCAASGQVCTDLGGDPLCGPDCDADAPGAPLNPVPTTGATHIDPDVTTQLTWDAAEGADSYAVYVGATCPPPAFPDTAFVEVTSTSMPVTLAFDTAYCWQVIPLTDAGCLAEGAVWSFETGSPCTDAPTCDDVLTPPGECQSYPPLDLFSFTPPPPASLCHEPLLRLAIDRITAQDTEDNPGSDNVYCLVTVESDTGGALQLTPITGGLDDGTSFVFSSIEETILWGHGGTPAPVPSDLLITYDCYEQDDPVEYSGLLDALGTDAPAAGGTPGSGNGWVFTTTGSATTVAGGLLGLIQNDDPVVHRQQVLPMGEVPDLLSCATWTVNDFGTGSTSTWDYTLTLKAWGCIDNAQ